jgi:hypothetical protein
MKLFDSIFKRKKEQDFPPIPKWRPELPVDRDLIYEKAKYYTGDKLQFAIFELGTVVYFSNKIIDIDEAAKLCLDQIYNSHPDFKPIKMNDGNYLIEYSHPAFTIVFQEEIENHWKYIDKHHQDGLCPAEVLINAQGAHNVFDDIGKIGLFGRAKMFMDAQSPKIVRTFDPIQK